MCTMGIFQNLKVVLLKKFFEEHFEVVALISPCMVIIARYDAILDQSEQAHIFNHLSNFLEGKSHST